jgi:hypothetical protein
VRDGSARVRRRVVAAALALALALGARSIVGAVTGTIDALDERSHNAALDGEERIDIPGERFIASYDALRRFRGALGEGDRYALQLHPHDAASEEQAARFYTFALYYLLPALAVEDTADADAVLSLGAPLRDVSSFAAPKRLGASAWMATRR